MAVINLAQVERLIAASLNDGVRTWAQDGRNAAQDIAPVRRSRKLGETTSRFEEEQHHTFSNPNATSEQLAGAVANVEKSRRQTQQFPVPVRLVPTAQGAKFFKSRPFFHGTDQMTRPERNAFGLIKPAHMGRFFTAEPLTTKGLTRRRIREIHALKGVHEDQELGFVSGGFLKKHIVASPPQQLGRRITATITSEAGYSRPLEFGHEAVVYGHRTGKRVRARPFMRPVAARYRAAGIDEVKDFFPRIGG